ncbi:hypothetical protein F7Q99_20015 [Streptomyces kaniharaensis]|uniref:Uncharacterized protein n=1 Tax=Streptomyces kaniharaensis TaxID=212423 RepID=A0A6N7KVZ5_9ACTN|nr:hypothetical protein [Streptomyces kaniharaensis]MQS14487.1 hypothetical protein [Streptomyces kaniharaensis]
MTDFPIPTGPLDKAPVGYRDDADNETALLAALAAAGVQLGKYDERLVTWLASWEWATVAPIASWITRANQPAA